MLTRPEPWHQSRGRVVTAPVNDSDVGLPTTSSSGSLARLAVGNGTLYLPVTASASSGFRVSPWSLFPFLYGYITGTDRCYLGDPIIRLSRMRGLGIAQDPSPNQKPRSLSHGEERKGLLRPGRKSVISLSLTGV